MPKVDILLATYNGARFLPDQLASLAGQTHEEWRLILRDDGSSDGTPELVKAWARDVPQEVVILEDGDRGLGASGNFGRLLSASTSPYFVFCDQDDVWAEDKIERLLAETVRAEGEVGPTAPVLTHCDLTVVSEDLDCQEHSFWKHQGFKRRSIRSGSEDDAVRRSLVMRNFVTGCAMMGNARLRELSDPVPDDCAMHDWWVALVAGYLGEIRTVDAPCILYRQHGSNSLGAKDWSFGSVLHRAVTRPGAAIGRTRRWMRDSRAQVRALVSRHADALPPDALAYLEDYARPGPGRFLARKTFLLRHRVWPQSSMRALIMVLIM